jgi:hypothetical protein
VVVLEVQLEVRREFIDARGEQRNLNFGAAGVGGAAGVSLDDFGHGGSGKRHEVSLGVGGTTRTLQALRHFCLAGHSAPSVPGFTCGSPVKPTGAVLALWNFSN